MYGASVFYLLYKTKYIIKSHESILFDFYAPLSPLVLAFSSKYGLSRSMQSRLKGAEEIAPKSIFYSLLTVPDIFAHPIAISRFATIRLKWVIKPRTYPRVFD